MKKIFYCISGIAFVIVGCWKADITPPISLNASTTNVERKCAASEVLEEQIAANPKLKKRMDDIERFTEIQLTSVHTERLLSNGIIEIPVVVNVLFRTNAENISLAQIQSQIAVLNEDFSATNADYNLVPAVFKPVGAGNINIRFVLDNVIRKSTTVVRWSVNDAMKKSNLGGINPTSPTNKLNIWVVGDMGACLGYAQFPGGNIATDGAVIAHKYFGRNGTVVSPFNKGRTATHEIGHWLNLRHIWGDAICGNDFVNDTPDHTLANIGCPLFPKKSICKGSQTMMTMNYMDYSNDACMYMFSFGQRARMLSIFKEGGPRNSFAR